MWGASQRAPADHLDFSLCSLNQKYLVLAQTDSIIADSMISKHPHFFSPSSVNLGAFDDLGSVYSFEKQFHLSWGRPKRSVLQEILICSKRTQEAPRNRCHLRSSWWLNRRGWSWTFRKKFWGGETVQNLSRQNLRSSRYENCRPHVLKTTC